MSDGSLERMYRRLMSAAGLARFTTVNDAGPTQTAQINFGAQEVHDNRFRLAEYGFTSNPLPGADAYVAFIGGDRSAGIIIATGDRRYRLKSLAPGEVALYDDLGHIIRLSRSGIAIDGGGHDLTITNAPKVTVDGDIEATGDIKAGTISLRHHIHSGVQPGSGNSGQPVP